MLNRSTRAQWLHKSVEARAWHARTGKDMGMQIGTVVSCGQYMEVVFDNPDCARAYIYSPSQSMQDGNLKLYQDLI